MEYGQQLEFRGKNDDALAMFESALSAEQGSAPIPAPATDTSHKDVETRTAVCRAGVARCTLRLGDLRKGLRLAREAGSLQLFRECASILEGGYIVSIYARGGEGDRLPC